MKIVKTELYTLERVYELEISYDIVEKVYAEEAKEMYDKLEKGYIVIDDFLDDAYEKQINLDWQWVEDRAEDENDIYYEIESDEN